MLTPARDKLHALEQGFSIGRWRIHPHVGRLTTGWFKKTVRHIEPKAMQVLLMLATSPGEFHSKQTLLKQVWDGRPITDDCLTRAIYTLRQALGDDSKHPDYIETRTHAGYRLIKPIKTIFRPAPALFAGAGLILLCMLTINFLPQPNGRGTAQPNSNLKTIAVLPFSELSAETQEVHLSEGITEALIYHLAQADNVRVIAKSSINAFLADQGSLHGITEALGADLVIEGSVQMFAEQIRVHVQLFDPASNSYLWSNRFDRAFDNILHLQADLSQAIAGQLGLLLTKPYLPPLPLSRDQLDRYLLGKYLLAQEDQQSAESALIHFNRLIEQQTDFAQAYLGRAQALLFLFKTGRRDQRVLSEAYDAAITFESLTNPTAASHRCLGQIALYAQWNFKQAENRYQKALLLNPSDIVARRRYAWLLVALGRYDEAVEQTNQLRWADPMYYENVGLATLLLFAGDYPAAIREFERVDANSHMDKVELRTMAMAYYAGNRTEAFRQTLMRIIRQSGQPITASALNNLNNAQLYQYLLEARLFKSPIVSAGLRNLLGQTDAALLDLEHALSQRDPFILYIDALPELASIRLHPRFQAILQKIGLNEKNHTLTKKPQLSSRLIKKLQGN